MVSTWFNVMSGAIRPRTARIGSVSSSGSPLERNKRIRPFLGVLRHRDVDGLLGRVALTDQQLLHVRGHTHDLACLSSELDELAHRTAVTESALGQRLIHHRHQRLLQTIVRFEEPS